MNTLRIYLKEELYQGIYIDRAPDLVILSHHGYNVKPKVNSDVVFGQTNLVGMHTQDDAFFFSGSEVQCGPIFDAKGIILELLIWKNGQGSFVKYDYR